MTANMNLRYGCHSCSLTFSTKAIATRHINSIHGVGYVYTCEICQYSTPRQDTYKKHLTRHVTPSISAAEIKPGTPRTDSDSPSTSYSSVPVPAKMSSESHTSNCDKLVSDIFTALQGMEDTPNNNETLKNLIRAMNIPTISPEMVNTAAPADHLISPVENTDAYVSNTQPDLEDLTNAQSLTLNEPAGIIITIPENKDTFTFTQSINNDLLPSPQPLGSVVEIHTDIPSTPNNTEIIDTTQPLITESSGIQTETLNLSIKRKYDVITEPTDIQLSKRVVPTTLPKLQQSSQVNTPPNDSIESIPINPQGLNIIPADGTLLRMKGGNLYVITLTPGQVYQVDQNGHLLQIGLFQL